MRANFNIESNTWLIFKTMCAKLKAIEKGKERQATASDVLRELIYDWIIENKGILNEVLDMKIGTQAKIEKWKREKT